MKKYTAKVGRFNYDENTKKVTVNKDSGILSVYTNLEGENHLSWVNDSTKIEELNIIVFPFDAVFEKLASQKNTFILKFESNSDRYFFYLQEKIDPEQFVKRINQQIAYTLPEEVEQEAKKMDIQQPREKKAKLFEDAFIHRLEKNLFEKQRPAGVTHLSQIITQDTLNELMTSMSQDEKQSFIQFLPEEQKDVSHLRSNLFSPQFQQALDVLTDAMNSENAIPLFIELGLDQKFLKHHFGVHAFLKGLEDWANRQIGVQKEQKMEEQAGANK